ncbi:hypothetical protein FSP39_013627 [Pinctada imbricata]|uniref:G-protein coupled receptors family 1 profile domain-containing protein n=1 Tax=Pinctada imbricata TaxID=66713 RepID=A0AA88XLH3_PINIB|nr:hypothetical protein FSP39_013627 [Pinctada imbricata]
MENGTDFADEYISKAMLPNVVIYTFVLFIGLLGNIAVFCVYVTKVPRERFKPRYFVPVLSFFDTLVCIVSLIYYTIQRYRWISFHSDIGCKLIVFFVVFTMMTSDGFLLAIAIQRYRKICLPFGKYMSLKWRRISVVAVIFAGLVYSVPSLTVAGVSDFVIEYKGVNISGLSCYNGNKEYPLLQSMYHIVLTVVGTANIILTAGMYAPIAVIIIRRQRKKPLIGQRLEMSPEKKSDGNANCTLEKTFSVNAECDLEKQTQINSKFHFVSSSALTGEHKLGNATKGGRKDSNDSVSTGLRKNKSEKVNFNLMFFTIIVVYVVSYIPTAVTNIRISLTKDYYLRLSPEEYGVSDFFVKFYVFNHVVNPFIYVYFDTLFRNYLKSIRIFHLCP